MINKSYKIVSDLSHNLFIEATPGHFVTSHSHINYYIDVTQIKHEQSLARDAAKLMCEPYNYNNVIVDAIICMDGSEVLGAFLARELAKPNMYSSNAMRQIFVVPPEFNSNGQMIFRDNLQRMVANKNCVLLMASVTTGKTIKRSLECIEYYGGKVVGISAVFSAQNTVMDKEINSIFKISDVPDYKTCSFRDCRLCKASVKIDAIVNSFGYTEV